MYKSICYALSLLCFVGLNTNFLTAQNPKHLVPLPVSIEEGVGSFQLGPHSRLLVSPQAEETANYLAKKLRAATHYALPIIKNTQPSAQKQEGDIVLSLQPQAVLPNLEHPQEAYTMDVTTQYVEIQASATTGLFYGVQSLLQLLPPTVYSGNSTGWEQWSLPVLSIKDYPRFGHRGFMLDVSRQFYSVATVKQYLEWMAMHKINVLHWHLTDDNGWRVEIKKYPKLTSLGAWRGPNEALPPSYGSGTQRYGGFYSQQEIKDIVALAQKLHITIIPEIDLPGHSKAAVAAYPEIFCESTDVSISVNGENKNLWCIGREANYKMLDGIIAELAQLFPGPYIHIGGDEVNPGPWQQCPHCQELMKKEGMKEVMELQAYFVKRMEKIVEKHGKTMAGWDEIMDRGASSPRAAITAWRNVEKGIESVRKGHPTIMQPGSYTYIDMKQSQWERGHSWAGIVTLERIYSFDPVGTAQLSPQESKLLLGVQAGLWGELLDRPARIPEYQMYPRLCALAEIGWTPQEKRQWEDFSQRIGQSHYNRMYEMGIAFRVPPPTVQYTNGMLVVTPPYPWSVVRYTDDESEPNMHSPICHYPIVTQKPWNYRFATFYRDAFQSVAIPGALRVYQKPETTAEASFALSPRFKLEHLVDYNPETYLRSTGLMKEGDYLLFRFAQPLNGTRINVHTGIPGIPTYYVEDGHVEYSLDGETFVKAGDLVYGQLRFTPPKGVKALRIVMGPNNFNLQTSFTDLQIEEEEK